MGQKNHEKVGGCHLNIVLESLEFSSAWVFFLLPLPILFWLIIPKANMSRGSALKVPFFHFLDTKSSTSSKPLSIVKILLAIICWCLLVSAAARPQLVGESVRQPVSGRSLMMAVDISMSMDEPDMVIDGRRMARIRAVKAVAGDFISKREGDRIGLILFGSQAYLQVPLTFDRKTASALLEESFLGLAGRATAIGDAIGLAVKRLREENEQNRVLILLTDGANTAGNVQPLKAADLAAQENVKIYTIGVGALGSNDLDEPTLMAIADKTDGRYFRARDVEGLLKIYEELDDIEPVAEDELSYRPVEELFYYPLSLALLLSVLIALLSIFSLSLGNNARKTNQATLKEVV